MARERMILELDSGDGERVTFEVFDRQFIVRVQEAGERPEDALVCPFDKVDAVNLAEFLYTVLRPQDWPDVQGGEPECGSCRFWAGESAGELPSGMGYCHRRAPQAVLVPDDPDEINSGPRWAQFPITRESDACGEYIATGGGRKQGGKLENSTT